MPPPAIPMTQILRVFGQPAVVTRPCPDDAPLDADVIWLAQQIDVSTTMAAVRRVEGRRVLILSRAQVPTAPHGTKVAVADPPAGTDICHWVVDGPAGPEDYVGRQTFEFDHHRVLVVADPEVPA